LDGVSEPERVRKLLQGSAKLEFWETFDNFETFPLLENLNKTLGAAAVTTSGVDTTKIIAKTGAETSTSKLASLVGKDAAKTDTASLNSKSADQAKKNPLFALLSPSTYQTQDGKTALRPGPIVGWVLQKDTAKVSAYIHSEIGHSIIPKNVKFAWSVKPISAESKVYELYALKTSTMEGGPVLGGDVISDARADYDQRGNPEVISTFTLKLGILSFLRM
jgi:SecD/SecF fusion protein